MSSLAHVLNHFALKNRRVHVDHVRFRWFWFVLRFGKICGWGFIPLEHALVGVVGLTFCNVSNTPQQVPAELEAALRKGLGQLLPQEIADVDSVLAAMEAAVGDSARANQLSLDQMQQRYEEAALELKATLPIGTEQLARSLDEVLTVAVNPAAVRTLPQFAAAQATFRAEFEESNTQRLQTARSHCCFLYWSSPALDTRPCCRLR
jgi:hypothetical protein